MSVKIPTWHIFFHRVFKYVDDDGKEQEEAEKIIEKESVCAITWLRDFRMGF